MKISVLTPSLSNNSLGRAYLLADILQRHYEVEIIGPVFGAGIWEPLVNSDVLYKPVPGKILPLFALQIPRLLKKITGNVIYVSKPCFSSYDIGLVKKWVSKKPLVLDIDDWEVGFSLYGREKRKSLNRLRKVRSHLGALKGFLLHPEKSYRSLALNERLAKFADQVTVSNTFLKERFGGTIVWHARDTARFDPDKFDKKAMREKHGIDESARVVMFSGTPQPHKGIEDLVTALKRIPEALLVMVGKDERKYCQELVCRAKSELGNERVRTFGLQPFSAIPQFLAMSDIVVIPQRKSYATVGQIPAKVFDAMAMAKPIIATKVSDLPEILNGCGWLVEPNRPDKLAGTIRYVLDHPEEAKEKGWKARERCEDKYSYNAMEEVLLELFKRYE
jgi:glycosyltransferase involved in cell wall biosynthesis